MTSPIEHVQNKLQTGHLLLDGPMGTELQRRGFKTRLPLWSAWAVLEDPKLIKEVHKSEIEAGADIVTTNTFRTQKRTFKKINREDEAEEATRLAVQLAKEALKETQSNLAVAGCMTTLEDCYSPELTPSDIEAEREHKEQAQFFANEGVDLILLETMSTASEAVAALKGIKPTGLPVMVSFVPSEEGTLLDGTSFQDAISQISEYNPIAIGANCAPLKNITKALLTLRQHTKLPLLAYGNGQGRPADDFGWTFESEQQEIEEYIEHTKTWIQHGASGIGACCGASPTYTKKLQDIILTRTTA